ncbi:MAG: hypothetical protein AAGB26_15000 [Planctomycetota bacterium]
MNRLYANALLIWVLVMAGCMSVSRVAQTPDALIVLEEKLHLLDGPEVDGFPYIQRVFTEDELYLLHEQIRRVEPDINQRLTEGDYRAAWVAGYLRLRSSLQLLRQGLLAERYFYGWEGPDYTQDSSWLHDWQYTHHLAYIAAIEAITGRSIHEAVVLTDSEFAYLRAESVSSDISKEDRMRARWLLLKLKRKDH